MTKGIMTNEEIVKYIELIKVEKDEEMKKELKWIVLESVQKIVLKEAHSYSKNLKIEFDDLVQEGNIAVLEAIERFNPNNKNNAKFSTYVTTCIKFKFADYRIDKNQTIRISEDVFKLIHKIKRKVDEGMTVEEICEELKISEKKLYETLGFEKKFVNNVIENDEGNEVSVFETIAVNDYNLEEEVFHNIMMEEALSVLTDKERKILKLQDDGYKLKEIGSMMGCSGEYVRKVSKSAKEKIQKTSYSFSA